MIVLGSTDRCSRLLWPETRTSLLSSSACKRAAAVFVLVGLTPAGAAAWQGHVGAGIGVLILLAEVADGVSVHRRRAIHSCGLMRGKMRTLKRIRAR